MSAVPETPDTGAAPEGTEVLLRQVPHGMVEQPSGTGKKKSLL